MSFAKRLEREQLDLNEQLGESWPPRPVAFGDLLTPVEAAQYLRLDETEAHTPRSALRRLNYWRDQGSFAPRNLRAASRIAARSSIDSWN